jgi:hypothetical protein
MYYPGIRLEDLRQKTETSICILAGTYKLSQKHVGEAVLLSNGDKE